jgi:eukaryotic-like serine/threonine-protein kinase
VPADYQPTTPDRKTDKTHWIRYTDYSGSIWIGLSLQRRAEDTAHDIAGSAAAEMYDDDSRFKESGDYDLSMPDAAKTRPEDQTYQGRKAAKNTVTYNTIDSQNSRPRELQIFYYRTTTGDMYKLTVSYPGKGDFTGRGREVARTAIANVGVDRL